jgi:hypothetical protein
MHVAAPPLVCTYRPGTSPTRGTNSPRGSSRASAHASTTRCSPSCWPRQRCGTARSTRTSIAAPPSGSFDRRAARRRAMHVRSECGRSSRRRSGGGRAAAARRARLAAGRGSLERRHGRRGAALVGLRGPLLRGRPARQDRRRTAQPPLPPRSRLPALGPRLISPQPKWVRPDPDQCRRGGCRAPHAPARWAPRTAQRAAARPTCKPRPTGQPSAGR